MTAGRLPRMIGWRAVRLKGLLPLALLTACGPSGECEQGADCPAAEAGPAACLEDLERGDRYCTSECEAPLTAHLDPCPLGRVCVATDPAGADVCVERVGACGPEEGCQNGLDDNCDGVTDESPCGTITCFGDGMCGEIREFACILNGPTRTCGPWLHDRNAAVPCNANGECYSNHCAFGYCAEACGVGYGCPDGYVCLENDLPFPACVRRCFSDSACPDGGCVTLLYCVDESDPKSCTPFDVCVR